ncbi:MAG: hypothetical protein K1X29_09520 [Bdellovibrionales bacterium]|nr:hypothetical protein [Bdellovibrionales bacterium]
MKNKSINLSLSFLIAAGSIPFSKVRAEEHVDVELSQIIDDVTTQLPLTFDAVKDLLALSYLNSLSKKSSELSKIAKDYIKKIEEIDAGILEIEGERLKLSKSFTEFNTEVLAEVEKISSDTSNIVAHFKNKYGLTITTEIQQLEVPGGYDKTVAFTIPSTQNVDVSKLDLPDTVHSILKKIREGTLFQQEMNLIEAKITLMADNLNKLQGFGQSLRNLQVKRSSVLSQMKSDPELSNLRNKFLNFKLVRYAIYAGEVYLVYEIGEKIYLIYTGNDRSISLMEVAKEKLKKIKDENISESLR